MAYLGFYCLGAFIGILLTQAVNFINSQKSWASILGITLAAAFGGAVMLFIQILMGKSSVEVFAYPVGLLVAYMWKYSGVAMTHIRAPNDLSANALGWGQMGGYILVSLLATAMFVTPAVKEISHKPFNNFPATQSSSPTSSSISQT
ncbi:MAG: hypothetical protein H7144_07170 [Burkholderiales bacterium]|nr:hypothetical protein [Phycisphaerae bacterium]